MAQRDEVIKRTVYVSDIDQQVKICGWLVLFSFCIRTCVHSSCFEFRSLRKILLLFLLVVAR